MTASYRAARAFTLLEIIIVVGLIAALAGALIVNLKDSDRAAKIKIEENYLTSGIDVPLMNYRLSTGTYPTTSQGLAALLQKPADFRGKWRGPFTKHPLVDSWGSAYNYRFPGEHFESQPDIWSSGPNRINEDGAGDDINNWDQ
ncbi:MAG: type II secretion system protein GspG [Verrucomicrobiota bacterium]